MKTNKTLIWILFICLITGGILLYIVSEKKSNSEREPALTQPEQAISLPSPRLKGRMSLEEAIQQRRSVREYQEKSLNLEQVSQLLWSAQGITDEERGFRAAPSAGALYPLDIYLVVGENGVDGLDAGVYHYLPEGHQLEPVKTGDMRRELMKASVNQKPVGEAPLALVITGEYERTTKKYGERGKQYVHIEAGHAAQNICLQAVSLGLGTVTIGAFYEEEIQKIMGLPESYVPLYVMPVGWQK